MEATTTKSLHPALWVAAISATTFSLVGIASMTGLLPHKAEAPVQTAALTQAAAPAPVAVPEVPVAPAAVPTPAPAISEEAAPVPAAKPAPKIAAKPRPVHRTPSTQVARRDVPPDEGFRNLNNTMPPPPPAPPAICADCGVVEAVNAVEIQGEAKGVGAVAGGVVGGVVGNQIGNGNGRTAARILGMIGGAVAGHQIEKAQRKTVKYDAVVHFEDGATRHFSYDAPPPWQPGARVKMVNGALAPNA
jgi:outer membrane lipoprotein SlyB